jgi:hypothetical protein
MRLSILGLLPTVIMLSACATDSSAPTSDYCRIYEPISWATNDTPQTVQQIVRENAKYLCLCNNECPEIGT